MTIRTGSRKTTKKKKQNNNMDAPLSWPDGWPWRQTSPSQIAWTTKIAEKGLCYLTSITFVIYWLSTSNVASARTSTETSYFLYYDFIS